MRQYCCIGRTAFAAEAMVGSARRAHADAIVKAQAEMMARVRAEQQAITEKRAAEKERTNDESVIAIEQGRDVAVRRAKSMFHVAAKAADRTILRAAPLAITLMVVEPRKRTTLIHRSDMVPWHHVSRLEEKMHAPSLRSNLQRHR